MRGRENNPAKAVWPKQSDSNKVWRALNNIKIHGQKGTATLHPNGINISLKPPQGVAVADVGGKSVTSGVVAESTITKADGSTVDATIRLEGPARGQSFTFPSVAKILAWEYGYDDSGTWTAAWFGYWELSMIDYEETKNQAYINAAGVLKWLELGCAE